MDWLLSISPRKKNDFNTVRMNKCFLIHCRVEAWRSALEARFKLTDETLLLGTELREVLTVFDLKA